MSTHAPSRWYYLTLVGTILIALFPYPTRVTNWFGDVISQIMTPLSEPLGRVSTALRPQPAPIDVTDPERQRLVSEIEYLNRALASLERENDTLRLELAALRELANTGRLESYMPLKVRRAGDSPLDSSGAFRVNVGSMQGVTVGTVAYLAPTQLVGFISDVTPLTSTVMPITSSESDILRVRIDLPDNDFSRDPIGTLKADGRGHLTGRFQASDFTKVKPTSDMSVRLDDEKYGDAYTGMLVGRIHLVEPFDENPLYITVTVRPTGGDLQRVGMLYLDIPVANRPIGREARPNDNNAGREGG